MANKFASMQVQEIFPTPLWILDLDPDYAKDLNRRLMKQIYTLVEPRPPIPLGTTWQTDPVLHQRAEFSEMTDLIMQTAQGALEFLKLKNRTIEITGCWGNINPKGSINSPHLHPNNYFSGVYYVAIPGAIGRINFHDPRSQAQGVMPAVSEATKFSGNKIDLEAKEGRLVLFPAWLVHDVPINRNEQERVSISFNIMFSEFTEKMAIPLWKGSAPLRS